MIRALVLGDAACVMDDADRAMRLFDPDVIVAVTNIGRDWAGHVDHWCTLHPKKCKDGSWEGMEKARASRVRAGRNDPTTWAHKSDLGIDCFVPDWQGGSGLFAVRVALTEVRADRIVVAGMPIDPSMGHYYRQTNWLKAKSFRKGWIYHLPEIRHVVRSMSGWTKELLGEPTTEWLASTPVGEPDPSTEER